MLSLLAATILFQASAQPEAEPMACHLGPLEQQIGGTDWYVYACDDGASLVAVTLAENPAAPFVFIRAATDDGFRLYGEGNGDQEFTQAAFDELSNMTHDEFESWRVDAIARHSNNERETEDN